MLEATSTLRKDCTMDLYEAVNKLLVERYGVHFSEEGAEKSRKFFAGLCTKFGDEEVFEAWNIACGKYDNPVTALSKLGGILYNRSLFSSFIEEN
nr:MAG: hypothetical protein [Bacteriophage sp.]